MENLNFEKLAVDMISLICEKESETIIPKVQEKIEEKLIQKFGLVPQCIEVKLPDKTTILNEVVHEQFERVLKCVANKYPVYLSGPAGTGKNVICQQVAKTLGLDFYFTNAVTQEYKLTGFIDANGIFHDTQFYNAFTKGGLFFLDEMDASIPEVLIILNAALANGYFDFPKYGRVEAHPDFRVIAAGNTIGKGADNNYTGRYSLDSASLDRFTYIEVNYSPEIEKASSRGNKELVEFAHDVRAAAEQTGVEILFSYRSMDRISNFINVFEVKDDDVDGYVDILKMSILKGISTEDVETLVQSIKNKNSKCNSNKFFNALEKYAAITSF